MKKTFDLGMSVIQIRGFRRRLTITVEFGEQSYRTPEEGYFSIVGQIGAGYRWIEGGQCMEHIREVCKKKWHNLLDELLELQAKYHLMYCNCIPEKDAKRIIEIIEKGI